MDKFALTAQLLMQAPANLMQTVRTVRNAFKDIDVNVKVKTDVRALQGIENDLKRLRDAGKQTSQFYNEIGGILANATRRFAGISIATGTFLGLARAIKNGIGDAIVFEREMAKIAQATETSLYATKSLAKEIGNIGVKYGVASDELVKFARNFAQAGFNIKQTTAALELLAKTEAIGTFGTMENTMEGIITTLSVFSKEIKGSAEEIDFLNKSFDAINKISKKYAIESEDIITAIRRTGSTFKEAGGNINELMAVMTSIRATTRESADTIANGLKTIVTRLQRGDTADILKEIGVELVDLEGKFVGPTQSFQKLNLALSQYQDGSNVKAGILEKIGGTYQIGRLIPAIKNAALQQQILNDAKSAGGDIDKDYAITQETLANKITKTKEAFAALVRDLTLNTEFKAGISVALAYANAFIRIADALKGLLPLLAIWASISAAKASFGFIQAFSGGKVSAPKTGASKLLGNTQVGGMATGGFVSGAPGIDKNPAMLTDGEFVVNRKDAQKNKGLLTAINSGRKVRMLSGGSKKLPGGSNGPIDPAIQEFERELARIIKLLGKDSAKFQEALKHGSKILTPDQANLSKQRQKDMSDSGNVNGLYTFGGEIIVNKKRANVDTIRHEAGHAADRSGVKGSLPDFGMGPQLPSMISGSINNIIAKAATEKNVEGHSGEYAKYKAKPEEAYADLFKRAEPEGRQLLVNLSSASTNTKKVDEALKKLALAVQSGQVSFDQVTDANILQVARTRGVIQAPSNINKATTSPVSSTFIPMGSPAHIASTKNMARDAEKEKNRKAREEAERVKEQFSGMKSSSPKPPRNGPDYSKKEEEVTQKADRTGLYLLGLVGGVTALTESMDGLDEATKRSIQSSVAFGTIFYSIAKSSIPFLAEVIDGGRGILDNFNKTVSNSTKSVSSGLKAVEVSSKAAAVSEDIETASNLRASKSNSVAVSGAVSGFTIGLSIAVGMLEYFSSKLREAASTLDRDAEKEIVKFSETGMGSSDITKQKMIDAQKKRNSANAGWNFGLSGAISGGLAGAAAGAPFAGVGAIPGAAIGAVGGSVGGGYIGNEIGSNAGNKTSKDEEERIKKSVDVQYESIKAVNDFTKALELSKKSYSDTNKSFETVFNAANVMSNDLEKVNKSFDELSKSMFKVRDGWLDVYKPKKENLSKEEQDIYDKAESRKNEAMKGARVASGEVYNSAINKTVSRAKNTNNPQEIEMLFHSKDIIDGINEASKLFAQTINMNSEEGVKAFLEYRKSLLEDKSNIEKETLKQNESQVNSTTARESEIRLIMQLNSQFDQLTQTTLNLDRSQKGLDLAMGKGSSGIDPRRFSDVSRVGNMKDFESDVRAVFNGLGSDEQRISKEIINMAKVAGQFRKNILADDLNKLGNKVRQDPKESETEISNYLSGVSADFINSNSTMKKASIAYAKELLNGGHITAEKLKDFIDKFISGGKPLLDIAQALSETQKRNIEQIKATTSALVDIESAIEGLSGGLVDISETGRQRMSEANKDRATNGDLDQDIANRQVARGNSMRARLGNLGGGISSPQDLGNVLSKLQQKYLSNRMTLEKSGVDSETTARLESENIKLEKSIKSVTNELTRLTDQSARAADVMSQLDREQSKKDFVKGRAKDYVLGGAEERMSMQEQFQALQHVMQTGSFQNLPEDLRKSVDGLVDEIAKSDPNNKFVKGRNNAVANDANRLFGKLPPELDKVLRGGTSSKEDRLIDELKKINTAEIVAQNLLIVAENANTKAVIDLTKAINLKNGVLPPLNVVPPVNPVNPVVPAAQAQQQAQSNIPQKKKTKADIAREKRANDPQAMARMAKRKEEKEIETNLAKEEHEKTRIEDHERRIREKAEKEAKIQMDKEAEAKAKAAQEVANQAKVNKKSDYDTKMSALNDHMGKTLDALGPENKARILKGALSGSSKAIGNKDSSVSDKNKMMLDDVRGNAYALYSNQDKKIVVNPNKTDNNVLEHEIGHAVDRSGGVSGENNPSQIPGTFNNMITRASSEFTAKGNGRDKRTADREVYANAFDRANDAGKKMLADFSSTSTDASEVNLQLKQLAEAIRAGTVTFDSFTDKSILSMNEINQRRNGKSGSDAYAPTGGSGTNITSFEGFETLNKTLENAVNKIPEAMNTFSASMGTITTSLNGIAQSLSNITMKHEVNIGGQLSVAGFNTEKVAEALKDSLGEFISIAVKDSIDKQNKAFRTA